MLQPSSMSSPHPLLLYPPHQVYLAVPVCPPTSLFPGFAAVCFFAQQVLLHATHPAYFFSLHEPNITRRRYSLSSSSPQKNGLACDCYQCATSAPDPPRRRAIPPVRKPPSSCGWLYTNTLDFSGTCCPMPRFWASLQLIVLSAYLSGNISRKSLKRSEGGVSRSSMRERRGVPCMKPWLPSESADAS